MILIHISNKILRVQKKQKPRRKRPLKSFVIIVDILFFTKETYKEVFEAADRVFLSSRQVSVAAVQLDETLPAFTPQNQPAAQVAAVSNRRNNRGSNRGGRGRGGSNRGRGGGQKNKGQGGPKPRGPRHSSNPPDGCCERHYVHGSDAWYCLEPHSCPWKDRCTPKN